MSLDQRIQSLIDAEVKVALAKQGDSKYEEKWDDLIYEIDSLEKHARMLYEDCKGNGLNFNSIEAEGYLRGLITVKNYLEELNDE